ncbi:aminodeoxychorismate lyase [Moritella viscosa]|uniref:Aminodeoxychorismate lyase n=1 Tax=Moritella viscosa TaxID=80854 RepID=A0A090IJ95_9GAMM|nr:aminodeoxychorismate lyase [Moritella viscosa]CED61297.1 4-amino-4-deoxychorismate lyase [Moritella viscosa]SGY88396.1 4-amino-4-deoxychorismate lyase [Moritella viscosa]SGY91779.1 4-amino-4-deoxychorismate lyase [Moritella viscosa]SGY95331.1 4-amino-4-deoxychorismate lyase [Moritella viscosa]SGY95445.1 4-amino-4-deoxychorismate lyase [Moritella viscosa]
MIINGSPSQDVAIADRGFNFGDGHFTTIKIAAGQALLLDLHLARLQQACAALAIEFTQWNELLAVITQQALVLRGGVLKVTITRGEGGRGYSTLGCSRANWFLQHRSIPAQYSDWAREGIELMLCEYQQTVNPALAGLKTLNRLDQVMIKQELDANGMNDGLVCSTDGYVIETSVANVFWVIGDKVYTPSTERSGVEGVMKTHISNLLNKLGFSLKTGDYTISNVLAADEIFITNSVMEVVPVKSILKLGTQDNISAIGYDLSVNDSSVWRLLQQELHG